MLRQDLSNLMRGVAWQAPDAPAPGGPPASPPSDPGTPPAATVPAPAEPAASEAPKPTEAPKPAATLTSDPPAPLAIDNIKLPDGFKADEATMKGFIDTLSKADLTPQARAQALVDLHVKSLTAAQEAVNLQWENTTKEWVKTVANDKDIGTGDETSPLRPEVKASISKVLDAYGGVELRKALELTGATNHPAIVKAFAQISKVLTEGNHIPGNPPSKPQAQTAAQRLYPGLDSQG
jgi:hypothetical protein